MKKAFLGKFLIALLATALVSLGTMHFTVAQDSPALPEPLGWEIKSTVQITSGSQLDRQPCVIQDSSGYFSLPMQQESTT